MKNYNDVVRAIENSHSPTITDYVSKGFNMTFQEPWLLLGYTFLYFAASSAVSFLGDLASSGFNIAVQPVLLAGYFYFFHKLATGQQVEFSDFFSGFKERFGPIILANFLTTLFAILVIIAVMIPVVLLSVGSNLDISPDMDPAQLFMSLGSSLFVIILVLFVLILFIFSPFIYTVPILCLTDVSAMDAIKLSWKLALKYYLQTIGLLLLGMLITFGGIIALLVGILIALPAFYGSIYAAVSDLIGFEEEQEEDLTDHLLID